MNDVVADAIWQDLQQQINALNVRLTDVTQKTARAETVGGMEAFTYANRPRVATGGMSDGTSYIDLCWISDGRKSGEGAGLGTGQPCYFDHAADDWRVFRDDSIVTA